jgi:hypothetical protein
MPQRAVDHDAGAYYRCRMQLVRIAVVAVAVLAPRAAAADGMLSALKLEGIYGKIGVESGVAFGRDDRGSAPLLGIATTLVHVNDHLEWWGLQADALVDWNADHAAGTRWTVGPEAGVSIIGADISYFGERFDGTTRHGMAVRAKLTVGLAALYVRGAYTVAPTDGSSLEVGMQLKFPVLIKRHRRSYAGEVATR